MSENPPNADELLPILLDQFWDTFPPTWNHIRVNIRALAARQFDLSVEQFHVLRLIHKGITSASELAEVKQISRPAVSQAVDGLAERGLVVRRTHAQDRRRAQLELTPVGEALLENIFQNNRAWMAEKLSGLSAEEMQAVIQGLTVLHQVFNLSSQSDDTRLPATGRHPK